MASRASRAVSDVRHVRWALAATSLALVASAAIGEQPYRDLSGAGATFDTSATDSATDSSLTIRIGVFAPFSQPDGQAILRGVTLAVETVCAGEHGRDYGIELVTRSTDGPWGVASRRVASLAFDDDVVAIIGGATGHEVHLAELVSAKAWVPVVTPWATDLTIDYANVPWVFRVAPSDRAQARALLDYVVEQRHRRLVVATEGDREGSVARDRIMEAADDLSLPPALVVEYDPTAPTEVAERIAAASPDAIVVWGRARSATSLTAALRENGVGGPVFGPATLFSPEVLDRSDELGELVVAAPFGPQADSSYAAFEAAYVAGFGEAPRAAAALAYDTAMLVMFAADQVGPDRARIRQAIADARHEGVTGITRFDGLGGATREPVLVELRDGRWERVESPDQQ